MSKLLCKSHITALQKVSRCLANNLTMHGTHLILSNTNNARLWKAERKIYEAIEILKEVQ